MDSSAIRQTLLQGYLNQQLQHSPPQHTQHMQQDAPPHGGAIMLADVPPTALLEEFKTQVRAWIDTDNTIRKLQQALKERRELKKQLTEKLMAFMARYNIEDLNTRDGKLRFKVAHVKPSLSKKDIQDRMVQLFSEVRNGEELSKRIFQEMRQPVERATLRRIQAKTVQ